MKRTLIAGLIAASVFISCNNDKDKPGEAKEEKKETPDAAPGKSADGSGSFTVDATTFNGKVTTQTLAQNQFSVLCESDAPYNLFQATFKDKDDYSANKTFKPSNSFMKIDPGTVHISASKDGKEYASKSTSTGSIEVSGNTLTVKYLLLYDMAEEKSITVSATVTF
jgi:hypothetical protein